jgi:hypothetical protein
MFPQTVFQPFLDTASALVPNAAAIMLADILRKRAIHKGYWFGTSGTGRRNNIANYIRVALAGGVAGYVGLILWDLGNRCDRDSFKMAAPFALLAMVASGFTSITSTTPRLRPAIPILGARQPDRAHRPLRADRRLCDGGNPLSQRSDDH